MFFLLYIVCTEMCNVLMTNTIAFKEKQPGIPKPGCFSVCQERLQGQSPVGFVAEPCKFFGLGEQFLCSLGESLQQ